MPSVSESQVTGGTTAGHGEEWAIVADEEESDKDFAERMARGWQQEQQREGDMLELQMMLWQRLGRPRYEY